jgi:hypothetical protein
VGGGRSSVLFLLSFLAATAAGALLRLYLVADRVIADDAWYTVYAAVPRTYAFIVTSFAIADCCIPLALFDRALLQTVGLSELAMRVPDLLTGIASVAVFPILARDRVGTRGAVTFAWLLAIAPLEIHFSRCARPYSIAVFLVLVSAVAFDNRWVGRRNGWGPVYGACAVAAAYFHLTSLPAALARILHGVVTLNRERHAAERARIRRLLFLTLAVGVALLLLLGPITVAARLWGPRGVVARSREQRGGGLAAEQRTPGFRDGLALGEQPCGQHARPTPRRDGQPEGHRRGGPIGPALRATLDQVLPDRRQEQPAQDRGELPTEGDRLALVLGTGVPQQLVQLVDRRHRPVARQRVR